MFYMRHYVTQAGAQRIYFYEYPGMTNQYGYVNLDGATGGNVTGVKGNAESGYRTGDVNLTPANIGAAATSHTHAASVITSGTLAVARMPELMIIKHLNSATFSVNAGSAYTGTLNPGTDSGYVFFGIIGFGSNHPTALQVGRCRRESQSEIQFVVKNTSTTNYTDCSFSFEALFIRAGIWG